MPDALSQLVGRRSELSALRNALDHAARIGSARVFALAGEPGIGKSRLIAELAADADARGWLALTGRAAELERDLPFGVAVDALDAYLGSLSAARLRGLEGEQLSQLAAVFPALAGSGPGAGGLGGERYRSHHAVRVLLELLAAGRPCLLALDDLHWADRASLELVSHLLRRPPDAPVLLVLSFRPRQADDALRAEVERAEREGACERVELGPLSRVEADALMGAALDEDERESLYLESGGNPFYLEQLARTIARGEDAAGARPRAGNGGGVPLAVLEALHAELASLDEPARVLLRAAAVAGEPFTPDLAADVAELPEDEALRALDACLALGLTAPTDSPRWFRFRHPIVRRAVYESAAEGWRLRAHGLAAKALAERGASAPARAHHVELSARQGDEEAVALLAEAGQASARLAPASAARWFGAALRLLPEDGADGRRLELLLPLATALGSSGQFEQSRRALHELLGLVPEELAPVRGRVVAFMAMIEHLIGRHGEARETLRDALEKLPEGAPAERAALEMELAWDRYYSNDPRGMLDFLEPALALTREAGDRALEAAASGSLGVACYTVARTEEAREYMREARELVDELSDAELALRLDAFTAVGWCENGLEDYEHAVRHFERGLRVSRETAQGHLLVPMTLGLLAAASWQGRLADAARHGDEALEIARLAGSDQLLASGLILSCWVAIRRGDLPAALELGEEAAKAVAVVGLGSDPQYAGGWLAEARIESGDHARGRDALIEAVGGPEARMVEPAFRSYFLELVTRAELALGRVDEAAEWAERAHEAAAGLGLGVRESCGLRALAQVELTRGEPGRAADLALAAAEAAAPAHRVEEARALIVAGSALGAAGLRADAVARLAAARATLEECGAARWHDQAVRELRRLGERVGRGGRRGAGESGLESLSEREHEVADLVRDRLTNRQIAERLVLSEKTVERHMSRIFQKLGVSSRVELARLVESAMESHATKP